MTHSTVQRFLSSKYIMVFEGKVINFFVQNNLIRMKASSKLGNKTPLTTNLKKTNTIPTLPKQKLTNNRILIQNGKIICQPNPNNQQYNSNKTSNFNLNPVQQNAKNKNKNTQPILGKKLQIKAPLTNNDYHSSKLPSTKNTLNQFKTGNTRSKTGVIPFSQNYKQTNQPIKKKHNLVHQQKCINQQPNYILHDNYNNNQTHLKEYFIDSPITMKRSIHSHQHDYTPQEPFFKSTAYSKYQKPSLLANSKSEGKMLTLPTLQQYHGKVYLTGKNSPKVEKMKYSMVFPSNSSQQHFYPPKSKSISKKLNYYTQPNYYADNFDSNSKKLTNYPTISDIKLKMETSIEEIDRNISQEKTINSDPKAISPKSDKIFINKNKKISITSNKKYYYLENNKNKNNQQTYTNQQSPKQTKSQPGTNYQCINNPQKNTQSNHSQSNLTKKLKANKLSLKQENITKSKIGLQLRKEVLNNLRKQYNIQINNKTQAYQQLSLSNNKKYGQQQQTFKIKHLYSINNQKSCNDCNYGNVKMSLSIIEEKPYRNQFLLKQKRKKTEQIYKANDFQPKKQSPQFSKKKQKYAYGIANLQPRQRRLSQPLVQHQAVMKKAMMTHVDSPLRKKMLDETMETQSAVSGYNFKISDFIRGPQLGRGKFGVVNLAVHRKSGFVLALKTMKKSSIIEQRILQQVIRQIKIQYLLNHPHLVKLYGVFSDKDNIYLLQEYCSDGQLYKIFRRKGKFTEEQTSHIMKQLCQGIYQMHQHNIIHRDLKPENVVVSFSMCKVCDFGWSIHNKEQFRSTLCGTPLYFSPELLTSGVYNEKVDIWALGMMAFEMINGSIPFSINHSEQLMKIANEEIHYPGWMSNAARDFIGMFLQRNPQFRHSIAEILSHRFLKMFTQSILNGKTAKLLSYH